MALEISLTKSTGHINTYWRVVGVVLDAATRTARVTLAGYASAAARIDGKLPDDYRTFEVTGTGFAFLAGYPVPADATTAYSVVAAAAYALAKRPVQSPIHIDMTSPSEFATALDV